MEKKIFYRISELMLATLIQRYDTKSFHFKNERLNENLQTVNIIYQFIKPFLDNNMSIFKEYGDFMYDQLYYRKN